MSSRIVITERAARELEGAALWWKERHSKDQAERWYEGFIEALKSLEINPVRFASARENGCFSFEIRQLNYGVGSRPTHRAVFTTREDLVIVLTIRHLAQKDITIHELP